MKQSNSTSVGTGLGPIGGSPPFEIKKTSKTVEKTIDPIIDPKIEEKKKQLDLEKEMKELYRKYEGLRRLSLSVITTGAKSLWKSFWGN